MANKRKHNLKGALAKHNAAQQLKAKQKAADEARERKHASIIGSKGSSSNKNKNKKAKAAAARGDLDRNAAGDVTEGLKTGIPSHVKGKQRLVEPFERDDTILLVGEGNFSFTLSLLSTPRSHNPALIVATAYDTEQVCYSKYPDAEEIVSKIRELAGRSDIVQFGIDAGNLQHGLKVPSTLSEPSPGGRLDRLFSKIWFGFPHVGAGHKDEMRNVLANQLLLSRFFISAAPLLSDGAVPKYAKEDGGGSQSKAKRKRDGDEGDVDDELIDVEDTEEPSLDIARQLANGRFLVPKRAGSALITLRNASPYTLWDVPTLGKRLATMMPGIVGSAPALPKGVRPPKMEDIERAGARYRLWRSFEFVPQAWPGYSHRRTFGWVEGRSTGNNEDLLRRSGGFKEDMTMKQAKHAGTGECRTWEFGRLESISK